MILGLKGRGWQVLSMLVPRLLQRYLLSQLLPEIGKYLIEAEQSIHLSGNVCVPSVTRIS